MKTISFVLCLFLISSCSFIPWQLSVMHTAADVVVRERTGKTTGEHAVSEVTRKDCVFARILDDVPPCMSKEEQIDYILSKNCDTEIYWNFLGLPRCR